MGGVVDYYSTETGREERERGREGLTAGEEGVAALRTS
jgi:hypothetical protein